jgi:hypothetical protein
MQVRIEARHRKDEKVTPDVFHSPSHHLDKERDKATNLDLFNIRHCSRKSTGVCMTFWRLFTHLAMGVAVPSNKDILLPDSAEQPPQIGSRHFSPDMQDNASLVAGNEDGYLSIFSHL